MGKNIKKKVENASSSSYCFKYRRANIRKEAVNINGVCISYCVNVKGQDVSVYTM
jgi:hypothetical protein